MESKTTVEQQVEQLAADVELLVSRTRPGVREIVIDDEVKATQAKWAVDEIECLNPQYLDTLRAKKAKRYDEETSDVEKAIAPRIKPLREAIGQRFADARRLRSESERLDPNLHPERYINARLLDELCRGNAERFLKDSEDNERAILEAYHAADDRRDVHLVKEIERRYGLTDEAPGESISVDLPLRRRCASARTHGFRPVCGPRWRRSIGSRATTRSREAWRSRPTPMRRRQLAPSCGGRRTSVICGEALGDAAALSPLQRSAVH